MKKTLTIIFLFLLTLLPLRSLGQQTTGASGSPSLLPVRAGVVTLLGFVEVLDREVREVTIDGKKFRLAENLVVTKEGNILTINELSEGNFVVATIKEGVVTEVSIMPPGSTE